MNLVLYTAEVFADVIEIRKTHSNRILLVNRHETFLKLETSVFL